MLEANELFNPTTIGASLAVIVLGYTTTRIIKSCLNRKEQERIIQKKKDELIQKVKAIHFDHITFLEKEQMEKIVRWSTSELLENLQKGVFTAEDVMKTTIFLTQQAHLKLNCLSDAMFEQALARARELDATFKISGPVGPLHGLPVSIKDNFNIEGCDTTLGVAKNCGIPRERSAVLVQVLERMGAVPYCKTNVPQSLLVNETENFLFGRTVNSWHTSRTPGGSSGGEGALVACGASRLGFGTDIGGSLRLPAHYCGLCTIKPTLGRLSREGVMSAMPQYFMQSAPGPLVHNVEDLAIVMRALCNSGVQQQLDPTTPLLPFKEEVYGADTKLRIGYFVDDGWFTPGYSCQRAVLETVELLKELGHEVVPFPMPIAMKEVVYLFMAILSADGCSSLRKFMEGEKLISSVQLILTVNGLPQWLRTMAGSFLDMIGEYRQAVTIRAIGAVSVEQEWRLQHQMRELKKQFLKAWQEAGLDVLLSPPNILPALPHGAGSKLGVSCGYSVLYNVLDFPAGVLPVTLVQPEDYQGRPRDIKDALDKIVHSAEQDSETMPVGVQVAALPWREELVLRVMKEIEAAQAHKFDAPKLHRQFRFKEWAKVANHGCLDREDVI